MVGGGATPSSRDHDVTGMVNRPPPPGKGAPRNNTDPKTSEVQTKHPRTPMPGLNPQFTFTSPSPEILKNDEEPAGHEEGEQSF